MRERTDRCSSAPRGAEDFRAASGGSRGGGYGLGLIVPDADAARRIARIMRELCEKDAARGVK